MPAGTPSGQYSGLQIMSCPRGSRLFRSPSSTRLGVILSCGASPSWDDECSFLTNLNLDIAALGAQGNLRVHDFVISFQEDSASFQVVFASRFMEPSPGIRTGTRRSQMKMDLPQEGLMLVVHAVTQSIERKFEPVELGN
ncbi:unnamed protein product [Thlaspi arvense]|uniref:C2 domain-containing protein n=1 Tax=Thlaspi arvense TaxID=13288 RepID=A0AAU9RKC1_THLAR|nr:unnamed protein product [Thlaspi arvense]